MVRHRLRVATERAGDEAAVAHERAVVGVRGNGHGTAAALGVGSHPLIEPHEGTVARGRGRDLGQHADAVPPEDIVGDALGAPDDLGHDLGCFFPLADLAQDLSEPTVPRDDTWRIGHHPARCVFERRQPTELAIDRSETDTHVGRKVARAARPGELT